MASAVLPSPTASLDELLDDVSVHGYGLLTGLVSPERLSAVRAELVAVAAAQREAGNDDSYHGASNQRVYALLAHSPLFVEVAAEPTVIEVATRIMGVAPILSNLSANIAGPGGRMQSVHADQGFLPEPWTAPWGVQVIWMLDDFTEDNGATRLVPGSHLRQGRPEKAVSYAETIPVCAPAGTLAIYDARTWHGTGKHVGEPVAPEDRRHALLAFYCQPFLRAQENWAMSLDPEVYKGRPELARLLSILPWQHLGLVDGHDADIGS